MSNIDKRALRNLATSLDGDDWHAEGNSVYGGAYDVGDNVCYDLIASCESVNGESPHADFIAAANPATVLALLDELEAVNELFMRAKALMYQSGGTPIENSLNPIDAWLYDAEREAAAGKGEAS
ncbi:TPA: ead/Ea22-like family protein [Enterobacter hormaechei]|nr:ead/Ea22-like family protein [Enterobacter hormaechei]